MSKDINQFLNLIQAIITACKKENKDLAIVLKKKERPKKKKKTENYFSFKITTITKKNQLHSH